MSTGSVGALKGRASGRHLIPEHADRVDVGTLGRGLAHQQLRRDVQQLGLVGGLRPQRLFAQRRQHVLNLVHAGRRNRHRRALPVLDDPDDARVQPADAPAAPMQRLGRVEHLAHKGGHPVERQRAARHQLRQAASLQQVRDDVDHLGVLAEVADLNQVGMRHLQRARFTEETRAHGLAIGTAGVTERPNRDRVPQRAVRAGVNLGSEAPLRDDRPQFERAKQRRHRLRQHPRRRRIGIVERPGEVHHGRPSFAGLLGQRAHHGVADLAGQIGPAFRKRHGRRVDVPVDEHHEAVAFDRAHAGQQLVDDHAQAVLIGLGVRRGLR